MTWQDICGANFNPSQFSDLQRARTLLEKLDELDSAFDLVVRRPLKRLPKWLRQLFPQKWPVFLSLPVSLCIAMLCGVYMSFFTPVDPGLPPNTPIRAITSILQVAWMAVKFVVLKLPQMVMWSIYWRLHEVYARLRLRPFVHQRDVGATDIRLVKIIKTQHGLIHCTLHSFPIGSRCPSYRALSYTWGAPSHVDISWEVSRYFCSFWPLSILPQTRLVVCNGEALFVTQNLRDALLHVAIPRDDDSVASVEYWWIDQMCINQDDVSEKSSQVSMMGQIYRQASKVVVWLGRLKYHEANTLDLALIHLNTAGEEADFGRLYEFVQFGYTKEVVILQLFNTILASRTWFTRIWIVQELILARDSIFCLGHHRLSHKTIMRAARIFDRCYNWSRGTIEGNRTTPESIIKLLKSQQSYDMNTGWTIEQWILVARGRRASDRRDLLYAGFALFAPHERRRFSIDYGKSTDEVLSRFTEQLFSDEMGIEALSLSERGGVDQVELQHENSWEVNFEVPIPHTPLTRARFAASPTGNEPIFTVTRQNASSSLEIHGAILDEVVSATDLTDMLFEFGVQQFFDMLMSLGNEYQWTDESPLVAMARTMTADESSAAGFSPQSLVRHLTVLIAITAHSQGYDWIPPYKCTEINTDEGYAFARHILYECTERLLREPEVRWHKPVNVMGFGVDLRKTLNAARMAGPTSQSKDLFTRLVENATVGRKLFMTGKGIIGLGPAGTRAKDKVCILKGSRVPYIIKHHEPTAPAPDTWQQASELLKDVESDWEDLFAASPALASWSRELATEMKKDEGMTHSRVGKNVLKGEAYVHGFMHGELSTMLEDGIVSWQKIVID